MRNQTFAGSFFCSFLPVFFCCVFLSVLPKSCWANSRKSLGMSIFVFAKRRYYYRIAERQRSPEGSFSSLSLSFFPSETISPFANTRSVGADGNPPAKDCEASLLLWSAERQRSSEGSFSSLSLSFFSLQKQFHLSPILAP